MKFTRGALLAVLAFSIGADAKIFGNDKRKFSLCYGRNSIGFTDDFSAAYEDWSLEQSLQFLKAQGIAVKDSIASSDVQKLVLENADAAIKVSLSDDVEGRGKKSGLTRKWSAASVGSAQAHFEAYSDAAVDT